VYRSVCLRELHSYCSAGGPESGSCEHDNELSDSIKDREYLIERMSGMSDP
jgi:hypothetical protein